MDFDMIKLLRRYINKEIPIDDFSQRFSRISNSKKDDEFEYELEKIRFLISNNKQYEKTINLINDYFGKYL